MPGEDRKVGQKDAPPPQTDAMRKRQKTQNKGKEGLKKYREAGILKRMHLKNFLCHANFTMNFGPNINFIHGRNGSGKSAIIAALQTCMGSRASETHRATSIKGLIRHGQERANVSVTIKNEGPEAYEPDVFGNEITIERELNRRGAHKYYIRTSEGKSVSYKRDYLDRILSHFSIQVTNPCVLLTQDDARALIGSSNPTQKYDFFVRATKLKDMKDRLASMQVNLSNQERLMEIESEKLKKYEKKFAEATREHKACQHILKQDAKLLELRKEMFWAMVVESEQELENLRRSVEKLRVKQIKYSKRLEECGEGNLEEIKSQMNAERKEKRKEYDRKRNEHESLKEALKAKQKEEREIQRRAANARKHGQRTQKAIKSLEREIQSLKSSSSRDRERDERGKKIESTVKELERLREAEGKRKEEFDNISGAEDKLAPQLREMKYEIEEFQKRESDVQKTLQQFKNASRNRKAVFGKYRDSVAADIERRKHEFKVRPVGPLGEYVKVRSDDPSNKNSLTCIEENLGRVMEAYLVGSSHDAQILKKILEKSYGRHRPAFFTQKKSTRKYDIARGIQHRRLRRVYDMIDIVDPWVHNLIVNQTALEKTYLCDDDGFAYDFLNEQKFRQHGLKKMNIILQDCTRVQLSGGRSVTRVASKRKHARYLQVDYSAQIRDSEEELKKVKADLERVRARYRQVEAQKRQHQKEIDRAEKFWQKTVALIDSQEKELDILSSQQQEDDADEVTEQINQLLVQIDDKKAELERFKTEENDLTKDSKEKHVEADAIKKEMRAKIEDCENSKAAIRQIEKKYEDRVRELSKRKKDRDKAQQKLAKIEEVLISKEQEQEEKQAKTQEAVTKAESITNGKRPEEIRSKSKLSLEIKALERNLDREKQKHGDPFAAEAALKKAAEEKAAAEKETLEARNVIFQTKSNFKTRKLEWKDFRRILQREVRLRFNQLLTEQGHSGKLIFDNDKQTMEMRVIPASSSSQTNEKTATSALSGGEKSFTTTAFILALGEHLHTPFRAMDEFDIFMDSVNRRMSMKLLINSASHRLKNQYLFLTPQDIAGIRQRDNIRIHQVAEAKRGQATLPANFTRGQQ